MKGRGVYLKHECALKADKDTASQQVVCKGNNRGRHHQKGPADLPRFICNLVFLFIKKYIEWKLEEDILS